MRLLVIEDDAALLGEIRASLERQGYATDGFTSIDEAETALSLANYDALIIDLGLPDGDGLGLISAFRARGRQTPVLIMTGRNSVSDRVAGLDGGGDDYIAKPFAMEELSARIRALLRRPGQMRETRIKAGNVQLDTNTREVRINGELTAFSRREAAALDHLMRSAGNVVPKEMLESRLYGFDEEVTSNSVEVCVSRLRKRLKSVGAQVSIRTLRGIGYVLTAEDAPEDAPGDAPKDSGG
ncbi:MAG: response regulator [Rhodospirillales bacterium]